MGVTGSLGLTTSNLFIRQAANNPIEAQAANAERITVRSSQSRVTLFIPDTSTFRFLCFTEVGPL